MDIKDVFDEITERFSDLYRRIQQLEVAATIPTGGAIDGSGTPGLIPEWTAAQTLGDSQFAELIVGGLAIFTGAFTGNRTYILNDVDGRITLGADQLTVSTINDATIASHTHQILNTSDSQTNKNRIMSSDANGGHRLARLGVGAAVPGTDGDLQAIRLGLNVVPSRNYADINCDADGRGYFISSGGTILGRLDRQGTDAGRLGLNDGGVLLINFNASSGIEAYLNNGGAFLIGTATSNTNQTIGQTIDQRANDDEAFNIRSSDVGAVLSTVETNTYCRIEKNDASAGGLKIDGFRDADSGAFQALAMRGWLAENVDTTKSTAGRAITEIYGFETDGTNIQNTVANGNVLAVRTRVGGSTIALMLVDEDGDTWIDGSFHSNDQGADPTPPANAAGFYGKDVAGTVEAFAIDDAGNAAQLTAHNYELFDPLPGVLHWAPSHSNAYAGVKKFYDMERALLALEALTGQTFIYTQSIPKRNWYKDKAGHKKYKPEWLRNFE